MARGDGGPNDLTFMEEEFCRIYTSDPRLSATKAAKLAGYSERSAASSATEILSFPRVQKKLAELHKQRFEALDYQAMESLREVIKIAHSDISEFFEEVEVDSGERDSLDEPIMVTVRKLKPLSKIANTGAIASIKHGPHGIEIKLWDKNKALDWLGKHFNLMTDKKEIDINLNQTGDLSQLSDEELAALRAIREKINK